MEDEKELVKRRNRKGFLLALAASTLWGISGVVLEFVAKNKDIPSSWFIGVRTLVAGVIILALAFITLPKEEVFGIFKSKHDTLMILCFAGFGIIGNMYTFYRSVQTGNSATATILQYLSPVFIVGGELLIYRKKPSRAIVLSIALAFLGTILLITKGSFNQLAIPVNSLIWGILSGFTAALYVIFPKKLSSKYSPLVITGWGMLLGSIMYNLVSPFWKVDVKLDQQSIVGVGVVILLGTILAFLLMVTATQYTSAAVVSITDAVQPITTFILSVVFLGHHFTFSELLGAAIVVLAVYILERSQATGQSGE